MKCPYCKSSEMLPYCTSKEHIFQVNENWFQLIIYTAPHKVLRIGYDRHNNYYIIILDKMIYIDPFNVEDCISVLDKYLKLKAFL